MRLIILAAMTMDLACPFPVLVRFFPQQKTGGYLSCW
jgi:hypothetical protein